MVSWLRNFVQFADAHSGIWPSCFWIKKWRQTQNKNRWFATDRSEPLRWPHLVFCSKRRINQFRPQEYFELGTSYRSTRTESNWQKSTALIYSNATPPLHLVCGFVLPVKVISNFSCRNFAVVQFVDGLWLSTIQHGFPKHPKEEHNLLDPISSKPIGPNPLTSNPDPASSPDDNQGIRQSKIAITAQQAEVKQEPTP